MAAFQTVLVTFVVAVALFEGTSAQSSCTPALVSLSPCLPYISGNTTTPSAQCCSQLSSVVQSQAQCLCTVINGAMTLPLNIPINQTQAMTLPGACKIQTPPVSQCKAVAAGGAPAGSPLAAPGTASSTTPSTKADANPTGAAPVPSVPKGSGSKTTGESSDARTTKMGASLLFFVFMSSWASTFFSF